MSLCSCLTLHRALLVHLALGQCIYIDRYISTGLKWPGVIPTGPCGCVIYCVAVAAQSAHQIIHNIFRGRLTSFLFAACQSRLRIIHSSRADQTIELNLVIKAKFLCKLHHSLIKLKCDQRGKMKQFPLCSSNMGLIAWKL